jgi:hypothetical protein
LLGARRLLRAAARLALGLVPAFVAAQSLEQALMPGELIRGHAKYEADCRNCHIPFDRARQDQLCADCHKDVGADIRSGNGLHGRQARQPCRNCHTDHKGRTAVIVQLDRERFRHGETDFALAGAHASQKCESCHQPKARYRDAPGQCNDCHRKDDRHKGRLGERCRDCHGERTWKEARFDHGTTRFGLREAHLKVECRSCHPNEVYRPQPLNCNGCHAKDDKHRGSLGSECGSCHTERRWTDSRFDHAKTGFVLAGRHGEVQCKSCHKAQPADYRGAPKQCVGCHRADDRHRGNLGSECADCHGARRWTEVRFDHGRTGFALLGRHRDARCATCHKTPTQYRGIERTCHGCHGADDKHKGRFGDRCQTCHGADSWKTSVFEHDRDTRYPLRGAHRRSRCESCHTGELFRGKAATTCIGCHRGDDRHRGQLGGRCESCHDETDWKRSSFDHNRSPFVLAGAHQRATCKSCHHDATYKGARTDCAGCHGRQDAHKGTLGGKCESCHNTRDWKAWDFDHGRRTRYALEGMHRPLPCRSCHVYTSADLRLPTDCAACHVRDDVHGGAFGRRCERCHGTESFRSVRAPGARTPR